VRKPLDRSPLPPPEQWEEFIKLPCWKALVEEMMEARRICMAYLCSNTKLKAENRDNFPEHKFEKGRLFSIETCLDLPATLQQRAKEEKDARNRGTKNAEGAGEAGEGDAPV